MSFYFSSITLQHDRVFTMTRRVYIWFSYPLKKTTLPLNPSYTFSSQKQSRKLMEACRFHRFRDIFEILKICTINVNLNFVNTISQLYKRGVDLHIFDEILHMLNQIIAYLYEAQSKASRNVYIELGALEPLDFA